MSKKDRNPTATSREHGDDPRKVVTAARLKLGLTQSAFARLLETPLGTVRGWEQGRRRPPPCALLLMRIAVDAPEVVLMASGAVPGVAKPVADTGESGGNVRREASATAELHEPGDDAEFWLL
jgi:putative transcriptional regulator